MMIKCCASGGWIIGYRCGGFGILCRMFGACISWYGRGLLRQGEGFGACQGTGQLRRVPVPAGCDHACCALVPALPAVLPWRGSSQLPWGPACSW